MNTTYKISTKLECKIHEAYCDSKFLLEQGDLEETIYAIRTLNKLFKKALEEREIHDAKSLRENV